MSQHSFSVYLFLCLWFPKVDGRSVGTDQTCSWHLYILKLYVKGKYCLMLEVVNHKKESLLRAFSRGHFTGQVSHHFSTSWRNLSILFYCFFFGLINPLVLSIRILSLSCSVLAAKNLGDVAYANFLDHTYLADRKMTIREYLRTSGLGIMEEEPPESLKSRYGGWYQQRRI